MTTDGGLEPTTLTQPAIDGMATNPDGPVMISWAHRANPGLSDETWTAQVAAFASALRVTGGIDADVDLFHLFEPGVDWTRWGPMCIRDSSRVLVAVNAAWRQRFEGTNPPTEGAGAVAEADTLLGLFAEDQQAFAHRVVLVLLPGASGHDVPVQLHRVQRVRVPTFDAAGLEDLLRLLTGQPRYTMPPLGRVPQLPAATVASLERIAAHPEQLTAAPPQSAITTIRTSEGTAAAQASASSRTTRTQHAAGSFFLSGEGTSTASGTASVTVHPEQSTALRAWWDLLAATTRTPPTASEDQAGSAVTSGASPEPPAGEAAPGPTAGSVFLSFTAADAHLAEVLHGALQAVEDRHVASRTPAPDNSEVLDDRVAQHLAGLMQDVATRLERANRCWLVLAVTPVATTGPSVHRLPSAGARDRSERLVREMVETRALPMVLPGFEAATRAPGRIDFAGHPTPARDAAAASTLWRLELGDGGEGTVAMALADEVQVSGGFIGARGQPGEVVMDAELSLPVRRDHLELRLLVALELLAAHAAAAAERAHRIAAPGPLQGEVPLAVGMQARLLLPATLTAPRHHHTTLLGVQVVEEHRDPEGHATGEHRAGGSKTVVLGAPAPTSAVVRVSNGNLADPAAMVTFAHQMAVRLLEYFGLEDARVLRDGGELDELSAGEADQQAVWQHARALGLRPVDGDPTSPAERRQRYEELREQARAALRRGPRP